MQNWVVVDEKYLNYLRDIEPKIPYSDYGENKFKPFFGELFEIGDLVYITQVSHPKERHHTMNNAVDFIKLYDETRLLAVVNLNYMFPVPKHTLNKLEYDSISNLRHFQSLDEKNKYIALLKRELREINKIDIENKSKKVYGIKKSFPNSILAKRCLDFEALEKAAMNYE